MRRIYIFMAVGAALAVSCSKVDISDAENGNAEPDQVQSSPIRFAVQDISLVKSGISEVSDISGNIHIRGTRGGSVISKTTESTGYEDIGIILDSNTGLWKPDFSPEATWQYEDIETREVLDSTKNPAVSFIPPQFRDVKVVNNNYSFSAYAFNNNVPEGVTPPAPSRVTSGEEFGKSLKALSQPTPYIHPSDGKPFGYDYVLSNRYDVSTYKSGDKISGDVVKLHMEHALASVNVKFEVSHYVHYVKFLGIRLEGFYRTADMTCTSQAVYGTSSGNVWVSENLKDFCTLLNGGYYSRGNVDDPNAAALFEIYPDEGTSDYSCILMNFCAIPQLLTKDCLLTVDFYVQQIADGPTTRIRQTWELMRYDDWAYGQRNNYTIRLNSSTELVATFDEWPVAYEVNGTILP